MIFCEMVTWTVRDGADGHTLLLFNCMSVHFSAKLSITPQTFPGVEGFHHSDTE